VTKPTTETRRHGEGSGDRGIGKSGDRKSELTAETRTPGEERSEHLTTEARRHGESRRSNDFPDHPITRSLSASVRFRKVTQTIRAVVREIFDESAYDRFLLRTQASRSVASYRDFTHERDAEMAKKPRCC
jgi:hypothetical protein